jgi:predicted Zn-dependent protease
MTLIVEDGSIVTSANTYINLADARTRATILGVSISATDGTAEQQLEQAALYVDREYRARYQGYKTIVSQPMQFPRCGVYIDGFAVDTDNIPQEIIDAQVYATAQLEASEELYANSDGKNIASEGVDGVVSISYFDNGKSGSQVKFNDVSNTIKPLLRNSGGILVRR